MHRFLGSLSVALAVFIGQQVFAASDSAVLFFHSERTPIASESTQRAPLLQRELVRQALLLAAREELGLATRDEALREISSGDAGTSVFFAGIIAASGREEGMALGYFVNKGEPGSEGDSLIEGELSMLYEYEAFTAEMERLSRTEFPNLLRANGVSGRRTKTRRDTAPEIDQIKSFLSHLSEISQFQALRMIHRGLDERRDSRELLGAAVRAYGNLGQLTREHWSVEHKVFQARSLLYAERLVVNENGSPWSLAHRAYARALVGRHHTAIQDLEKAMEAEAELPWLTLISMFLRFDTEGLIETIEAGENESGLAALLASLNVEFSESEFQTFAAGAPALAISPNNFRIHGILYRNGGISIRRRLATESRINFLDHLIETLPEMEDLPEETAKLLKSTPPGISEAVLRRRVGARGTAQLSLWEKFTLGQTKDVDWWTAAELVESLRNEGANTEGLEPSWSVLATLIEESNFSLAQTHLSFLARTLCVNVDESLREHLVAETASHPLASILPTFWVEERRGSQGVRSLLTEMNLAEVPMVSLPLIGRHSKKVETFGNMTRLEAQMLAVYHGDRVYDDLLMAADYYVSKTRAAMLTHLIEISPASPHVRGRGVRYLPELAGELISQEQDPASGNPETALAIARECRNRGELDKAVVILEKLLPRMPDLGPHVLLAEIYLEQGEEDRWLETLINFIENGQDLGLSRTRARERIARHFLETGRAAEAVPYAEAAARSWAASALLLAANTYFAAGNMAESLAWFEARHKRYPGPYSPMAVYLWRVKSEKPLDDEGLIELHEEVLGLDANEYWRAIYHGAFHFYEGDTTEAIRLIESAFRLDHQTPRLGLVAAMIADDAGLESERDRLLSEVAESDPERYSYPESRAASMALAEAFLVTLAGDRKTLLDRRQIEDTIDSAHHTEKQDLAILVGHFLDQRGMTKEALHYYRSVLGPRHNNKPLEPLLYKRLRALGVDPQEMLREKLQVPSETE